MITKGIITQITNDNKFMVRLPLFESAGNFKKVILPATLCYVPGSLNGYAVDDVVFIAFENNQISQPVIIGKLYLGAEKETSTLSYNANLETTSSAKLPKNTSVGNLEADEVYSALMNSEIHETRLTVLEQTVKGLLNVLNVDSTTLNAIISNGISTNDDVNALFDEEN